MESTTMKFIVEFCMFVGLVVAILRPKWLLYFLIFSLLEPSRYFSLGNYVILGTVNVKYYELTLLLIYVGALWNHRRPVAKCVSASLVVFLGFALLSLVRGVGAGYGEAAFNQFRTFFSLGMCVAVPLMFKDADDLRPVLRFFFAAVVVVGSVELLGLLGLDRFSQWAHSGNRYYSLLSATQGAILAMPFLYILSTIRYIHTARILSIIGGAWCFIVSVLSMSRGVWLGLIGSTVGVVLLLPLRRKVAISAAITLLCIFVFMFARTFHVQRYDMSLAERFKDLVSKQEGTARWRMDAWRQMIEDIRTSPFLGFPFGTRSTFYVSYSGLEEHAPHNEYLKIARHTGMLGFSAFVWFMTSIFVAGSQYLRKHRDTSEYYEMLGFMMCFLFHVITALFTQAFTTMDRSPIVWAIPGIITLYRLTTPPVVGQRERG